MNPLSARNGSNDNGGAGGDETGTDGSSNGAFVNMETAITGTGNLKTGDNTPAGAALVLY